MGTVVRDWRLANRPGRRRATGRSRTLGAGSEPVGHELRLAPPRIVPRRRLRGRVATVLALVAVLAVWGWWLGAERRAVRALPPGERTALFGETMRGFEDLCRPPRAGLEQHCRRQASFLLNFPECDEHCVSLTRPVLQWRT